MTNLTTEATAPAKPVHLYGMSPLRSGVHHFATREAFDTWCERFRGFEVPRRNVDPEFVAQAETPYSTQLELMLNDAQRLRAVVGATVPADAGFDNEPKRLFLQLQRATEALEQAIVTAALIEGGR